MSVDFERTKAWRRSGIDGEGFLLTDGYRWLLSVHVFGFHLIFARSAWTRFYPHRPIWCWIHGHDKRDNNLTNPNRRYYCPQCGTVWTAAWKRSKDEW